MELYVTLEVTPYVGVWIETVCRCRAGRCTDVTPYVGVWIETGKIRMIWIRRRVTPYVGVWIETYLRALRCRGKERHSLCGSVD